MTEPDDGLKRKEARQVENYFQKALSDFAFEAACGGAIRHLADLGYTARQITDRLSFSVPYDRVRRAYTQYLLEKGVLLRQEPSWESAPVKVTYVQEYGKYGKPTFRRVEAAKRESASMQGVGDLAGSPGDAGERYVPCDFGISGEVFQKQLSILEPHQREYLEGICWEPRRMYHLRDERMEKIWKKLGGSP